MTRMIDAATAALDAQYPLPSVPPKLEVFRSVLDNAYIRRSTEAPDVDAARNQVRKHHADRFEDLYGPLIAQCDELSGQIDQRVPEFVSQISAYSTELRGTPRYVWGTEETPRTPWSLFERFQIGVYAFFFVMLIGSTGLFVYLYVEATYPRLIERQWWATFLFFAIPLIIPLALEIFEHSFQTSASRQAYFRVLMVAGIVLMGAWIVMFSTQVRGIFSDPSSAVEGIVSTILREDSGQQNALEAYRSYFTMVIFSIQPIGEGLLAAGLWIHMRNQVREHQGLKFFANPEHSAIAQELAVLVHRRDWLATRRGELLRTKAALVGMRTEAIDHAITRFANASAAFS
jgi:hypothetical protein